MPFNGYQDFGECVSDQKRKGLNEESANKVCGSLQSKTVGASLTDDEVITAVKNAIKYSDCIAKAKEYGHDDDAAKRICDQVTGKADEEEDIKDKGVDEEKEGEPPIKGKKASIDAILENIDSLLGAEVEDAKKKKKDNIEEEVQQDNNLNADTQDQNDTPNLEEDYDGDINACIDDQQNNGKSVEDSRKYCNDLAKGASTKEAYISTSQRDGDPTGDVDTPQEFGSSPIEGHRKNRITVNPHEHNYGTDGPDFNSTSSETNTSNVGTYTTQNSTLEGNDHIDKLMDHKHKKMYNQHIGGNQPNQGLGQLGQDVTQPDPAPATASLSSKINAISGVFKEAISSIMGAASEPHPKVLDNCVKQKMKANDKLSEDDAKKQCDKAFNATIVTKETVNWIRNGTTYSAEQCQKDHGSDADAKSVCEYVASNYNGSYDAYQEDMRIKPFESNNKLFVKAFLMDSSVNLNQWGVSPNTLDTNIRTYIGKPLVLQEDFNHPVSADDTLSHQLEYQELFRVGTIVDIIKKDKRYEAISEITDPYAVKAFREGELPLYVSPQLYKMDAAEPDNNMTKWQGTHLAIVKEPAYGIKLATLNGECNGDATTCVSYLKKASILKEHGYGNCGFCNYKLLSSVRQPVVNVPSATILSASTVLPVSLTIPTDTISWTTPSSSISSLDTINSNSSVINLETEQVQDQKPNNDQILKENEKLRSSLKIAKESIEESKRQAEKDKSLNEKLSNRVAAIEMERRKERIANILQGAYKIEELDAKVESFAKSGLVIEEIDSIVTPLKEAAKTAAEQAKQANETVVQKEAEVKNASKQVAIKHDTKVAMKNASVESEIVNQVPSWLKTHDYLFREGENA